MIPAHTTYKKYLVVIGLGLIIFFLDYLESANPVVDEVLLFCISVSKSSYFIWYTFTNIRATAHHEFYFHEFVPFAVLSIVLIILSFGLDYFCLYQINPEAFSGDVESSTLVGSFLTFLYFSVTTFTTAGFGDIVPNSLSARIFVMMELFIAFFFTILVIANIAQIRESFAQKLKK